METTRAPHLTVAAQRVFGFLARQAGRDGRVTLSRPEIAEGTGLKMKSISAITARLEQLGYLSVEQIVLPKPIGRSKNTYVIPPQLLRAELARQAAMNAPREMAAP